MIPNFKSWIICKGFLGYIAVASALVVNFLMLFSCVIWPFNKTLYRRINRHLAYSFWINFTFWGQWWSSTDIVMKLTDDTDEKLFGKEKTIIILNHKYDIDWLMALILAERHSVLGGGKMYSKEVLKYMPLLGWAWYFTESIFLKRDWEKDQKCMLNSLRQIPDFPYPVWLLLMCEGTRFTDARHQQSMEYAEKVGLPPLKHHLIPRTKGFVHSMYALKGKLPAIYSCVLGFRTDYAVPTLNSIFSGRTCKAEMHIRCIPMEDIPTDSDESCANWLHQLYREKDELFDQFEKNGTFPGRTVIVPRRLNDLLMFLFWAVVTCVPLFYYVICMLPNASWWVQLTVLTITVILCCLVRAWMRLSYIDRGDEYKNKYNN